MYFEKVPVSELVTQTNYAKLHGVSRQAVTNWKAANYLVFAADPNNPKRKLVDVARSNLLIEGMIDPNRGRPTEASKRPLEKAPYRSIDDRLPFLKVHQRSEINDENLKNKRLKNIELTLDLDERAGALVLVSEFERRAGDLGRQARERIQSAFRLESERLAAMTDPRTVQVLCAELIDQTFESLADQIEAEARAETEIDQALAAIHEADPMLDLDQVAAA
jgi:hypothetical protein